MEPSKKIGPGCKEHMDRVTWKRIDTHDWVKFTCTHCQKTMYLNPKEFEKTRLSLHNPMCPKCGNELTPAPDRAEEK